MNEEKGKKPSHQEEPEIKSMKRDLARLRLSEAEEERKKIIGLQEEKPEPEKKTEKEKGEVAERLREKGRARKKSDFEKKRGRLQRKISSLKKKERGKNKQIQKIERNKKAVRNETEKKSLENKQKELKKEQSRLQREMGAKREELGKVNKKLSETIVEEEGRKKMGEGKKPPEKEEVRQRAPEPEKEKREKELSDVEKAKRRLESLSKTRRKEKKGREEDYRKSLEKRWEKKEKGPKELPGEVKEPVESRRGYPGKPSQGKRRLIRILFFSFFGLLAVGGGVFAFVRFGPEIRLRLPVFTCGGYEEETRCEEADCFWYENACHKKEKKECPDYPSKEKCEQEDCFWYRDSCHREEKTVKKECPDYVSKKNCEKKDCFWYQGSCHEEKRRKPALPPALVPLEAERKLDIEKGAEAGPRLEEVASGELGEGKTTELLFKNEPENKYLSLKEVLEATGASLPGDLFGPRVEKEGTLFFHTSKGRNRLGFVVRVKDPEGASRTMRSWEGKMEQDLDPLLSLLGKEGEAAASRFRTTSFRGTRFRYLTISRQDFGLCYVVTGDRLVFTTSFAGMKEVLRGLEEMEDLSRKAGQLFIIGFEGKEMSPELRFFLEKYKPGGVLLLGKNIEDREQLTSLLSDLQSFSRSQLETPLLVALDQEGGSVSRVDFLEEKTAQKEIESVSEAEKTGRKRAQELKKLGVNLNFAPLLEVTEEGDFIHPRTFMKDASRTGELGKALVRGQAEGRILTGIKHFPGYRGVKENPEEELAEIQTLPPVSPFEEALKEKAEVVMTANAVYEELDPERIFPFSEKGLDFLREKLGPEPVVATDDLAQTYLLENNSLREVVVRPLQAGVDLLVFSGYEIEARRGPESLLRAAAEQRIEEKTIEESYQKVVNLKQKLEP